MYKFLSDLDNKILNDVEANQGIVELDFTNEDHYKYLMEKMGGEELFLKKYPHLETSLIERKNTPLEKRVCDDDENIGPNDCMLIENISFHKKNGFDLYDKDVNDDGGVDKEALSRVIGNYKDKKDIIIITAEMYDVKTGRLMASKNIDSRNSYKAESNIDGDFRSYMTKEKREFLVTATYYNTVKNEKGFYDMNAHVVKESTFAMDGEDDIIEKFDLIDPTLQKGHTHEEVYVAYSRSGVMTDYDYLDESDHFLNHDHTLITVWMPFKVKFKTKEDYSIKGLNRNRGYQLLLSGIFKGGTANHFCNFDDIKQTLGDQDLSGKYHSLTVEFPKDWNNKLDFTKLGYQINTDVDLYGQLCIQVVPVDFPEMEPIDINVSVNSDKSKSFDEANIEARKIRIQWGCMGKNTMILLPNNEEKKVCELSIGDEVVNYNGDVLVINDIIKGNEKYIYKITTNTGKFVELTREHTVFTENKMLPVWDLKIGMKLKTVDGCEEVVCIEQVLYDDLVYNIFFNERNTVVGNKFVLGDSIAQDTVKEVLDYEY